MLLATFYVEAPHNLFEDIAVAARIQQPSGNNWWNDDDWGSNFRVTVAPAHYEDPVHNNQLRRRYKIDIFRREETAWHNDREVRYYRLHQAGTYRRRLRVLFNNVEVLTRMIYITIQPDIQVHREAGGTQIDMVRTTTEAVISENPLNIQRTVNVVNTAEALAAREIHIAEPNDYRGTVFVKSNLSVDVYSDDLSVESADEEWSDEVWLRLKEQIRMTRRVGRTEYRWRRWDNPVRTDAQGNRFTFFIAGSGEDNWDETALLDYPWYDAVELGLEKPLLELPLLVNAALTLHGRGVSRYTGTGETTTQTAPVNLPLTATLETPHTVKITPSIVTLNEDNNYTSFIAVETNDGVNWNFSPVDSRITITPSSGTGRAAVVVRKELGVRSHL